MCKCNAYFLLLKVISTLNVKATLKVKYGIIYSKGPLIYAFELQISIFVLYVAMWVKAVYMICTQISHTYISEVIVFCQVFTLANSQILPFYFPSSFFCNFPFDPSILCCALVRNMHIMYNSSRLILYLILQLTTTISYQ